VPKPRVIIELSPSRIEVATLRGTTIGDWRCERVNRADWPSPYTTALPDVAGSLTKLLAELGVADAVATVIYSAPGSVAGLTSCATSINSAGAEQAAMLSLANLADFPIEDSPSDTCTLYVDKPCKPTADAPALPAQRHIIACADAEERAAALCAAMAGCGLSVGRLIPADTVAAADAIRLATTHGSPEEIAAIVWVGEHSTSLAVGSPGRLYFVRTIAAGTEALAEVLCRPLRPRDPEAAPVVLAHDAARTMLLSSGVPAPDAAIPGHPTLAGSALLPHLQPILQRLAIEIKQSLRFGVQEADRVRVRLHLAGPGAAVPGLGEAFARVSGFPFASEVAGKDGPDALDSSTGGLISALVHCPNLGIGVLPTEARQLAKLRKGRKALLIGAALALAYIGYETFDAYSTLRSERATLNTLTSALLSTQGPLMVRQSTMAARAALADAEQRLRTSMDQSPDWSALMEVIAQSTPPEVRITSLDMNHDANRCAVDLRAYIRFDETPDPAAMIRSYVDALDSVPLIDSVRFGSTQRTQQAGHDSQTFNLTITVVPLPRIPGVHAASAAHETEGK
jgi:Tfp pilus assembly PilM family ATPase/Tfp pilus assembly protein PilN